MGLDDDIRWYRQIEKSDEYWMESAKIDFACDLERLLHQRSLTKRALAEQMGTSPAYITKALRGDANLTIDSMVRLVRAAGGELHLHIAPQSTGVRWVEIIAGGRSKEEVKIAARTWARVAAKGESYDQSVIAA